MDSSFIDSVNDGWLNLGEKSKTLKRRLRRDRIAMEKAGEFVPFHLQVNKRQPVPTPVDQPKPTNSSKRAARKRRKMARESECFPETDPADKPTSFLDGHRYILPKSKKENKRMKFSKPPSSEDKAGANECTGSGNGQEQDDSPVSNTDKGDYNEGENVASEKSEPTGEKKNAPTKKKRYVLFIGNLSFDTTEEDVREHFKKVGDIASVRLAKHKGSIACRGFGHLEVGDEETYLKALGLHHTFMAKRRINVEYSSGQAEERGELRRKNFKLHFLNKAGQLGGFKLGWKKTSKPEMKAVLDNPPTKGAFFV